MLRRRRCSPAPPAVTVSTLELGACPVVGLDAEPIPLAELWRDRPALLFFVRHFGCIMCRELLGELREALQEANRHVNVAVIGSGSRISARWFQKDMELGEIPVFVDESRRAYRVAGLHRGVLNVVNPLTLRNVLRAHRRGYRQTPVQGDNFEQGGMLLVDTDGSLRWSWTPRIAGQLLAPDRLLREVRGEA